MPLGHLEAIDALKRLQPTSTKLADKLRTITDAMEGRGISPADAPLKQAKLREIEQELRMLGADENNPVPYL